jgi:hypothetical protein
MPPPPKKKYRDMYRAEDISLRPNALDNYFHLAVPPHGSYNVERTNYAPFLKGEEQLKIEGALLQVIQSSAEWTIFQGGKEYRGVRTERYTYVKDVN